MAESNEDVSMDDGVGIRGDIDNGNAGRIPEEDSVGSEDTDVPADDLLYSEDD
jgi:hypothetical protein